MVKNREITSDDIKEACRMFKLEPLISGDIPYGAKITGLKAGCVIDKVLNIPVCIRAIGYSAFKDNMDIQEIRFNSMIDIEDKAFQGCRNLKYIKNSEYITEMGEYAFAHCSRLREFTCGEHLSKLSKGLFLLCTEMRLLRVDKCVQVAEDYSLFGCKNLVIDGNKDFKITKLTYDDLEYLSRQSKESLSKIVVDISSGKRLSRTLNYRHTRALGKAGENWDILYKIKEICDKDGSDTSKELVKCIMHLAFYFGCDTDDFSPFGVSFKLADGKVYSGKKLLGVQVTDEIKKYNDLNIFADYYYMALSCRAYKIIKKLKDDDGEVLRFIGL